jgi:Putative DNA-binding domain
MPMLALRDLQAAFARALLADDAGPVTALIAGDGLAAEERLDIYRNNVFASLTEVLRDTFPAVCRLVDERFFAYAAHDFIRHHPPRRAVLAEYGAQFATFLAGFAPASGLVYLPDVARLEWLMAIAASAAEAAPMAAGALAPIPAADTPRLVLRLHPALGYIDSPWPIDRIWRANRRGADGGEAIDLAAGGIWLEVGRSDGDVMLRVLDGPTFTFRQALAQGARLEQVAALALAADADFDFARGLSDLFSDGAVIDVTVAPVPGEALP